MIRLVKVSSLVSSTRAFDANLLVHMHRNGQVMPITVREIYRTGWFWFLKQRRYEVIDGERRLEAAKQLLWKRVAVCIIQISDRELFEAQIIASKHHVPTSRVEYRKVLLRILEMNPGLTRDELASRINWTRERLDKVLDESADV